MSLRRRSCKLQAGKQKQKISLTIENFCFFLSTKTEMLEKENEEFAKDMLYWILLTDQWPFRISYILEVIEDADQRKSAGKEKEAIGDDVPLLDIHKW